MPPSQSGVDQRGSRSQGRGRDSTTKKGMLRSTRGQAGHAGSHAGGCSAADPSSDAPAPAPPPRSQQHNQSHTSASTSSHSSGIQPAGDASSTRSSLPTSPPANAPRAAAAHAPASSPRPSHTSGIPGPPAGPSSRQLAFDATIASSSSRTRAPLPTSTVPLRHVQRLTHARAVSLGRPNPRDVKAAAADDAASPAQMLEPRSGPHGGPRAAGPTSHEDHAVRFSDESGSVTIRGGRIGGGSYMADSSVVDVPSPSDSAISFGQAMREHSTEPTGQLGGGRSPVAAEAADQAAPPVATATSSATAARPAVRTPGDAAALRPGEVPSRRPTPADALPTAQVVAPAVAPPAPPAARQLAVVQRGISPPSRTATAGSSPTRYARGVAAGAAMAERQAARRPAAQRAVTTARSVASSRNSSRSRLDQLWSRGGSMPPRRASTGLHSRPTTEGGHRSGVHAVSAIAPPRSLPAPSDPSTHRAAPRHFFHPQPGHCSPTKASPAAVGTAAHSSRRSQSPQRAQLASRTRHQPRAPCFLARTGPPQRMPASFRQGSPAQPPSHFHRSGGGSSGASGASGTSGASSHGSTPATWSPLGSQCMIRDACARLPIGPDAAPPSGSLPRSRSSSPPPSGNRTLRRDTSGPRSVDSCNLPVFPEDPQSVSPSARSGPHPLAQPPLPPRTSSPTARNPPPPSPASPPRRRGAKPVVLSPSHRSPSNCSSLAVRATESITDDSSSRVDSGITPVAHSSSRIHDSGSLLAESCTSISQPPSSRARTGSQRPGNSNGTIGTASPRHQSPYLSLSPILSAGLAECPGTPTMAATPSPLTTGSPANPTAQPDLSADEDEAEASAQPRESAEDFSPIHVTAANPNEAPFEVNDFAARIMGLRPAASAPVPSTAAQLQKHRVDVCFAQVQRADAAAQARHAGGRPRSVPTLRTAPAAMRRTSETNPHWDDAQVAAGPSASAMVDLSPNPPPAATLQPPASPRRRLSPRPPIPVRQFPPEALADLLRHSVHSRTPSDDVPAPAAAGGSLASPSSLSGLSNSSVTAKLLPLGVGHGAILPPPPCALSARPSPFGSNAQYPQYLPSPRSSASPPTSLVSASRHPSRPLPSYPSSIDSAAVRDIAAALAGPSAGVQGRRGISRSASVPTPGPTPPSPPLSSAAALADPYLLRGSVADAHHALRTDSAGRPLPALAEHSAAGAAPPMIASESGHHTALQHIAHPRNVGPHAALRTPLPLSSGAAALPCIAISPDFDSYFTSTTTAAHAPASASTTPRNRHYALSTVTHRVQPPSSGASGSSLARSPTHPFRPAGATGPPRSRDRFVMPSPLPPPAPGSSSLSRRVSTAADFPLSPRIQTLQSPRQSVPSPAASPHRHATSTGPARSPSDGHSACTTPAAAAAAAATVAPDECFDAAAAMAGKHALLSSVNSGASVASMHSVGEVADCGDASTFSVISRGGPLAADPTLSLCGSAGGAAWASCDGSVSLNWHILGTGSDCSFRHWSPTIAARSIAGGGGDTWNTLPEEERSDMAADASSPNPEGSSLARSPPSAWRDHRARARHVSRGGPVLSDTGDSAEFSSGALFGPWHNRHSGIRRSAAAASSSYSFTTTSSTRVGAAAAAAAAASAAATSVGGSEAASPGVSPKRGYSGLPSPLRSVVPVVALFGGWPRVAMSHLELAERLARVAADAAAAIAFLASDKEGVEVPHVLAAQLQRQMPASARGAGVTALASHYHAKLSGPGTPSPSAAACASSPGPRSSTATRPTTLHDTDLPEDWPKVTCALQPALAYLAAACTAAGSGDRVSTLLHLLSLQRLAALEASTHAAVAMLSHMRAVATSAASVTAIRGTAAAPRPQLTADAVSEQSSGRSSGLELRFPLEAAVLQGAVGAAGWDSMRAIGGAATLVAGAISDVSIDCEIMDSDVMDTYPTPAVPANLDVLATAARAADTVLAAVASAVDDSLPGACGIGVAVRVVLHVRAADANAAAEHSTQHVEVLLTPRTMMTAPEVVLSTNSAAWAAAPTVPAVDAPAFASGRSCPSECARGVRDLLCAAVHPEAEGAWHGAVLKVRPQCVAPLSVSALTTSSIVARDGGAHTHTEVDPHAVARAVVWPEQLLAAAAEAAARSAMGIVHASAGGVGWPPGCPTGPASPAATATPRHAGSTHSPSAEGDSDAGRARSTQGSAVFMHHNGACDDALCAADSAATDTTSPARGRSGPGIGSLHDLPRGTSSPSSMPVRRLWHGDSSSHAASSPQDPRRSVGSVDNAGSPHTLQRSDGSVGSHYSPCLEDMLRNETVRRARDVRPPGDVRCPTPPNPEVLLPHADASSLARCITRSSSSSSSSLSGDVRRSRSASPSSHSLDGDAWQPGSVRNAYEEVEGSALGGLASLPSVGLGPPTAVPSSGGSGPRSGCAPRSIGSAPRSLGSRRGATESVRTAPTPRTATSLSPSPHLRSQPASRVQSYASAYSSAYGSPMSPLTPASEGLPVRVRPPISLRSGPPAPPLSLRSGTPSTGLPPRPPLSIGRRLGARLASQGVRTPPVLLRSCFCVNPVAQLGDESSREL
eukprot:jgi/Ulvmu1/9180/UM005_0280.1